MSDHQTQSTAQLWPPTPAASRPAALSHLWFVGVLLHGLTGFTADTPAEEHAFVAPLHYVCYRTTQELNVDGRLDDADWKTVPWTTDFVDIEGDLKPRPRLRTRAKMLWDHRYFYMAAELFEPHVWGTLTKHDSVIFHDNDFEVFIDPDGDNHSYGELELNALNTTWDLKLPQPYKDGGKADNSWELEGLKTAVHIQGTLNDPRDTDRGWTVEIAIPWQSLKSLSKVAAPPHTGDQWRVNFSRVEWMHQVQDGKYRKIAGRREDNWVWSPQWTINMHRPETWGYVQFSDATQHDTTYHPDRAGAVKHLLHRVYYAQRRFQKQHKRSAVNLKELELPNLDHPQLTRPLQLDRSENRFRVTATMRGPNDKLQLWQIEHNARLWKTTP
ncbi:MAG: carbohydrate-binding family 9-like protein [Planctomycetaceae bacterium]